MTAATEASGPGSQAKGEKRVKLVNYILLLFWVAFWIFCFFVFLSCACCFSLWNLFFKQHIFVVFWVAWCGISSEEWSLGHLLETAQNPQKLTTKKLTPLVTPPKKNRSFLFFNPPVPPCPPARPESPRRSRSKAAAA